MSEPEQQNATKSYSRIINQLGSLFTTRREKAYDALRNAPSERVRPLLLRRLTKDLRAMHGFMIKPVAIVLAIIALSGFARTAVYHLESHRYDSVSQEERGVPLDRLDRMLDEVDFALIALSFVGIYGTAGGYQLCRCRRTWNAASILSHDQDPTIIGPLTELVCGLTPGANESYEPNLAPSVKTAWIRMLPTVRGESANSFNSRQRRCLRIALHKEAEPGFMSDERCQSVVAMMQCIAAIGDLEARPIVERISKWEYVAENEQAVSAQARECLLAFDLIRDQARTGAVLLRSSSDPGTQADILLRGANEQAEIGAAELLRAGHMPVVEEVPAFVAKSNSVKPEIEEVLDSKVGSR